MAKFRTMLEGWYVMSNKEIIRIALILLEASEQVSRRPGYAQLITELKLLQHRLDHRTRHPHKGHTSRFVTVGGDEFLVEYEYTPAVLASSAENPDDPSYAIPPEPDHAELRAVYSHSNLVDWLSGKTLDTVIEQVYEQEAYEREDEQ